MSDHPPVPGKAPPPYEIMAASDSAEEDAPPKKRKRAKKPADMPRRPLSAYNLFFARHRAKLQAERVANQQAKIAFEELGRMIGSLWRQITPQERKEYDAQARIEAGRYYKELGVYRAKKFKEKQQGMLATDRAHPSAPTAKPKARTYPIDAFPRSAGTEEARQNHSHEEIRVGTWPLDSYLLPGLSVSNQKQLPEPMAGLQPLATPFDTRNGLQDTRLLQSYHGLAPPPRLGTSAGMSQEDPLVSFPVHLPHSATFSAPTGLPSASTTFNDDFWNQGSALPSYHNVNTSGLPGEGPSRMYTAGLAPPAQTSLHVVAQSHHFFGDMSQFSSSQPPTQATTAGSSHNFAPPIYPSRPIGQPSPANHVAVNAPIQQKTGDSTQHQGSYPMLFQRLDASDSTPYGLGGFPGVDGGPDKS